MLRELFVKKTLMIVNDRNRSNWKVCRLDILFMMRLKFKSLPYNHLQSKDRKTNLMLHWVLSLDSINHVFPVFIGETIRGTTYSKSSFSTLTSPK